RRGVGPLGALRPLGVPTLLLAVRLRRDVNAPMAVEEDAHVLDGVAFELFVDRGDQRPGGRHGRRSARRTVRGSSADVPRSERDRFEFQDFSAWGEFYDRFGWGFGRGR